MSLKCINIYKLIKILINISLSDFKTSNFKELNFIQNILDKLQI